MQLSVLLNSFLIQITIAICCCCCEEKTRINILVLVPWPDIREHANYDVGPDLIPGARIAVREINNRSDILQEYELSIIEAGHEACGLVEHSLGLVNLVHFGMDVAVVTGLYCSTSTLPLSFLANAAELIQLSAANSPVFNEGEPDDFPHLWRFLESAGVYANMMIQLMHEYDWSRIAIVSNQENVFYDGIASSLANQLWKIKSIRPIYQGHLIKLIDEFESQVLKDLVDTAQGARIIFVAAEDIQVASLLCQAFERRMIYPNYLWIIVDLTIDLLIRSGNRCSEKVLWQALDGCIFPTFSLAPMEDTEVLESSGYTYATYLQNYYRELEIVKEDYEDLINSTKTNVAGDPVYSSLLYDQLWAFSLALNNSLTELEGKNLSLKGYRFGKPNITAIIEKNLKQLSFRGASGYVSFNEYREVHSFIDIFQVINGTSVLVSARIDFSSKPSGKLTDLTFSKDLDDEIPKFYQTVPIWVTGILVVSTVIMFVFLTVVLVLVIKRRKFKEIKAKSVTVSMLMFFACYTSIVAYIAIIILASVQLTFTFYSLLCNVQCFVTLNMGLMLFSTMYFKTERLYQIFHNNSMKKLSWRYNNCALCLKAIVMCAMGDMLLVINAAIYPTRQRFINITELFESTIATYQYPYCYSDERSIIVSSLLLIYLGGFIVLIIYYSSKLNSIRSAEFKETKLINMFLVAILITLVLNLAIQEVFMSNNKYSIYKNVINFFAIYSIVCSTQLILFVPSIVKTFQ